jgi:hypothetical protein
MPVFDQQSDQARLAEDHLKRLTDAAFQRLLVQHVLRAVASKAAQAFGLIGAVLPVKPRQ